METDRNNAADPQPVKIGPTSHPPDESAESNADTGYRNQSADRLSQWKPATDAPFTLLIGGLTAGYVLLILLMLAADLMFTSVSHFHEVLSRPEVQYAAWLSVKSCTLAAIMSVWVGVAAGYALSRFRFPGRALVDTIVDIPVVLPPLVMGLSLLMLFHVPLGGTRPEDWLQEHLGLRVTYAWPAVVLAQFSVSCAFAVRTMRVTFDQISPRAEDVARTLGCSRGQAFLHVALPQAWKGIIAAFTISWARALGEFGPIMVFAGSTRMKTEVLSTTVFLELSIGNLEAAVAVSLLMVAAAVALLMILKTLGSGTVAG